MKRKVPILRATTWNAMIDEVSRRLPLRFVRTGWKWMHPWTIGPEWDDAAKSWVFRIKPGFVNGVEPTIATTAALVSERTLDRIEDQSGQRPSGNDGVEALITEGPKIPIGESRIIGKGSDPTSVSMSASGQIVAQFEAVPEFFIQLGVSPESVVFTGNLNTGIQVIEQDNSNKEPSPVLRAVDVALHVDRLAAKLDVMRGTAGIDGYSTLLAITYGRSSPPRERPWLEVTSKFTPRVEVDLGELLQDATDPDTDSIKVATIYFVSPPGTSPDSPPDGKWQPFVKHDLFWNLAHAPQRIPDPTPIQPITLQTGLAGGIADPIFNTLLSSNNEAFNEALQVLRNRNLDGRFWSL